VGRPRAERGRPLRRMAKKKSRFLKGFSVTPAKTALVPEAFWKFLFENAFSKDTTKNNKFIKKNANFYYKKEFEKFKQQARLFNVTEEELKSDFEKLQFQINFKKIEKIIRRKKKTKNFDVVEKQYLEIKSIVGGR
jgi:hypothetical protein